MADDVRVEVTGYAELARDTGRLAKAIEEAAPKQFLGVAERVAASGRARVPRRSGALAGSVTAQTIEGGALVGIGSASVPYAGWIEFGGTRGRPYIGAGRYLYPTAIDAEPLVVLAARKTATDEIGGFRWSNPTPPGM